MTISKNTTILIVLGLILLGAIGYLMFGPKSIDSAVNVEGAPQTEAESTFANLTASLDPVKFDTSILTDPRFKELVDIHTPIISEPVGRHDPFAPLSGAAPAK